MKLKKVLKLRSKLIKIGLIKSQILPKHTDKFNLSNNLDQLEVYLKKVLTIIFQYHVNFKRILFLGVDRKIQKKFKQKLKRTRHLFFPESYWIRGLLTNYPNFLKSFQSKKNSSLLNILKGRQLKKYLLLRKKPHLIVMFNQTPQTLILSEAIKLKIPVVSLNFEMIMKNTTHYHLSGDSNYLNGKNHILLLFLNSILKNF
jgi:Ribosomal protein S2